MDLTLQDKLVEVFERLSEQDKASVMSFAEFLAGRRHPGAAAESTQPQPAQIPPVKSIPRPENEKVVAAVKRLSSSYFMLDKKAMLGVTSDLVTQHIVQGREADEVIDDLERLFADHYQRLLEGGEG